MKKCNDVVFHVTRSLDVAFKIMENGCTCSKDDIKEDMKKDGLVRKIRKCACYARLRMGGKPINFTPSGGSVILQFCVDDENAWIGEENYSMPNNYQEEKYKESLQTLHDHNWYSNKTYELPEILIPGGVPKENVLPIVCDLDVGTCLTKDEVKTLVNNDWGEVWAILSERNKREILQEYRKYNFQLPKGNKYLKNEKQIELL